MKSKRFWEVDFLRGIAVVMMIIFHALFDLAYFGKYHFNVVYGFWLLFARLTAIIFLFLVGISLTLSYNRRSARFSSFLVRGLKIFGFGLLITLVTWLFFSEETIIFGVLHLIGLSIIISYPFIKRKYLSLAAGIAAIVAGYWLSTKAFAFTWLMWLGVVPQKLITFDYFPLLPWFGVVLLGVFAGNVLYPKGRKRIRLPELGRFVPFNIVCFLGRNSLIIYLLHQPVLMAIMYFFF